MTDFENLSIFRLRAFENEFACGRSGRNFVPATAPSRDLRWIGAWL